MSRSFIYLRTGLSGVSCAIVFGFGATQAFAGPQITEGDGICIPSPGGNAFCHQWCVDRGYPGGKCVLDGTCACLINP